MAFDYRREIERHIASGSFAEARYQLGELWRAETSPGVAGFVVSKFQEIHEELALLKQKVAILRSFTVEPIVPLLRAASFARNVDLSVWVGEYNSFAQEILDEGSRLYEFKPDAVVLAIQSRDFLPALWGRYASLSAGEENEAVSHATRTLTGLIARFRELSDADLVVHNFELPAYASRGILDSQLRHGQRQAIDRINESIRSAVDDHQGVYLLDYDQLVARHGRLAWRDDHKWLTVRLPIAAAFLLEMAEEWLRFLMPLSGRISKVVAVDLDNTLWGGIVGEDGAPGLHLGPEYPGAAFLNLQQALLDLYNRGIVLAVCSKNNATDALEVISEHPEMILRPNHFAAMRINWQDKPQNLREICAELGVGTDSIALIDDNPVEREHVRRGLPEATVLDLPADAAEYADAARAEPTFQRLSLTEEDRQRSEYYFAQRQRSEMESASTSREEFLLGLDQEVEVAPVNAGSLQRAAQLTQKTNQFNLTTHRYTERQVEQFAEDPDISVLTMRVRDRYADNGIVGLAILRYAGELCEIDTFLLSCRVIGRTVESAFLAYVAAEARARGARIIEGRFMPTKKNAPASGFYLDHGFECKDSDPKASIWEVAIDTVSLACPEWIRMDIPQEVAHD